MKKKPICFLLLMVIFFVSCVPNVENAPTIMPTVTPTTNPTATPTSNPPTVTPASTATIQIEKWMEYEQALAKVILPTPKGICEWEILGHNNQEVYVWAICQVSYKGAAASLPAVIQIGSDGSIEEVQIPGDGTHYAIDIRKMFPQEIQDKIFDQSAGLGEMWSHIELRQVNPEPPLIVLTGVTLP